MSSLYFFCFLVIGVDLSNYALEDLLSFDDIFLDYFNNFLKNSVSSSNIKTISYFEFINLNRKI